MVENNNENENNKKSLTMNSVKNEGKKKIGKKIKGIALKVIMPIVPFILIFLIFYAIVMNIVAFFKGIAEAIGDFFTINIENGAYTIDQNKVNEIVEQLKKRYTMSELGILGDLDEENATQEQKDKALYDFIEMLLSSELETQTINTGKLGSNGVVKVKTYDSNKQQVTGTIYENYSTLWDENNPILTKEEFIKIVENFAVPAGKGESGRDHVQSYNKHFKANAEDFYNIPISCGINPMVVFAIGVHESGYGTSDIANDKNNFWGINAVDGDAYNKAYTYDTIQEGIKAEAELLKRYATEGEWQNTTIKDQGKDPTTLDGVGTLYASDGSWSQKVKEHLLNIFKDKVDISKDDEDYSVIDYNNKLKNMEFLKYSQMEEQLNNPYATEEQLKNYYSINKEGKLVIFNINIVNGKNQSTLQAIDYKNMISQYTTPWLFLLDMETIVQNPKFIKAFVDLIKKSQIDINILYNTNILKTTTTTYTSIEIPEEIRGATNKINEWLTNLGVTGHFSSDGTKILIPHTTTTTTETYYPIVTVGNVDTWIYSKRVSYNMTETEPISNTTDIGEDEDRVITNTSSYTRSYAQAITEEKYNGGKKGEKGTFVGLLDTRFKIPNSSNKHSAGPDLVSGAEMFFKTLQQSSITEKWEPIMRYILYVYTGKDYGVTDFDTGIFSSNLNSVLGIYGASVEEKVWFTLKDAGYSEVVIAGIMGNIYQESHFKADIVNSSSGATGICQWLGGRLEGLQKYATSKGVAVTDVDTQIEFLLTEINKGAGPAAGFAYDALLANNGYSKYSFKEQTTIEGAVEAFCWTFERPGKNEANIPNRVSAAKRYYNEFQGKERPTGGGITTEQERAELQATIENEWIHTQVHSGNGAYQQGPFIKYWAAPYNNLSPFQCTWWANGRASMYLEQFGTKYKKYPTQVGNGGEYYSINLQNGWFQYGSQPKANSIISWRKPGGYGHVAYVEGVTTDGIYISEAGSGLSWFGVRKIPLSGYYSGSYILNGYIYLDSPN